MLPDHSCFRIDKYGCPTLDIRADHLSDFPALVSWINKQGYGVATGLLKLHLHPDDRDPKMVETSLALLNDKFKERRYDSSQKKMVPTYNPDCQAFLKGSINEHIYEFVKCECTTKERKHFIQQALKVSSYSNQEPNCCSEILKSDGLQGLRNHLFNVLDKMSTYTDIVQQNLEALDEEDAADFQGKVQGTPLVYGAGIQVDPDRPIQICRNFSLSALKTIIDHLEEKYDGIAYPYLYVGLKHTVFPWHIEDGGLYSINYLMDGMPKIWYGIPPKYYGVVDNITSNLRLSLYHTSCRAVLGDHKIAVIDPAFFGSVDGAPEIPFTMCVQEPGDFIITFPFALHSGANLGCNLAIAANFGDEEWLELGMYAPVCSCMESQVKLPLTNLLRQFRPDLLKKYLTSPCLLPPPGHPRNVLQLPSEKNVSTVTEESCKQAKKQESCEQVVAKRVNVTKMGRTLHCPGCKQTFVDNKINRLRRHIQKEHSNEEENFFRIIDAIYVKNPKTKLIFKCKVCSKSLRGSSTHVKKHHLKEHPQLPYEGAEKA